ncbi:MAG: DUF3604 domain-containing protein [Pseudomonadales bacterium]|jgi:hypothetical protein|nr:DUF3604 domain-containing protein [Pseudomonadales bacterium]MDP6472080.1 DUF3604 domain-containing protein [Pseudomonadales bacterium]MDP6826647.1 DUF3604 domain-containing protein [Pseudomonadales bacterium]MDP6969992.1 DUF3604 domain-containing protein [Pseudomonadales bacterium]|tara:strand:- start:155 stop:946 length:792 start_codon:yes stop_codon:yes gene_type:complete
MLDCSWETLGEGCLEITHRATGASGCARHTISRGQCPGRNAYFGDLHVHTQYSFDASYIFNVRTNPDDAYDYAKGQPLKHTMGYDIRLRGASLDFMAVSDHATSMGVLNAMGDENHRLSKSDLAQQLISSDPAIMFGAFQQVAGVVRTGEADPRIQVRFFASYIDKVDLDDDGLISGLYGNGVPMGGDLLARPDGAPLFVAWATRDSQSAIEEHGIEPLIHFGAGQSIGYFDRVRPVADIVRSLVEETEQALAGLTALGREKT